MRVCRAWVLIGVIACHDRAAPNPIATPVASAVATSTHDASVAEAPDVTDASKACAPGAPPVELHLELLTDAQLALKLTAKNCSDHDVRFLYDSEAQVATLTVTSGGKTASHTDGRDRKHAATGALTRIAPGREVALEQGVVVIQENGHHVIAWGPFHYNVRAGTWRVTAHFTSAVANGATDAWLGSATSNAIDLTLE